MTSTFLQFLFSGLTLGAIYALAGLGFSIIYNASHVINFAQGEFLMIGAMATVSLVGLGLPLELAIPLAVAIAAAVGVALARFAVVPAGDASVVTVIIITIGASILLRGVAQVVWDKEFHALPAFSGTVPISVLGATMLPQSLWVMGVSLAAILALGWFFGRTMAGKAMLAVSYSRLGAQLVGVPIRRVLLTSFALSAGLGAIGGIVVAPITFTSYEAGVMLGLKGFSAAVLGGLGNGLGAVLGGLVVGIAEAMSAGYLSSAYKDATAFVIILVVLFFLPNGLLGHKGSERV
ncbi:branched-chain amino acid ABC transporter permease [Azospirillum sp. TSO22-1]|uniref:branched-chain amino acid ABC transporter permease n=1 Tax=Azospirillum sp. TSO22-1 TaxID=716789 RepID=UPI000D60766A|nr:branched-chain amino acid ABC transporter permease [Azospirillum sp. TSO22-1]PWC52506.1 ABC transporter permease [Azospirillum sp. TSO22-1]